MIPTAIGLDLSLTGTGVASSRGWTRVLHPPAKARGHVRLDWIRDNVLEHVGSVDEHLVVVEGPSYGNQGAGRQSGHHERAGLWWLITHALWKRGIDYAVASPAGRAKYATGKGNAAKADVAMGGGMACRPQRPLSRRNASGRGARSLSHPGGADRR
jgi:hypothetical protein